MEFPFTINNLFKEKIVKLKYDLLPNGFRGERRDMIDCASKISQILDDMGRASAIAQGLNKPITSGERLRNSEHLVYLLIDPEGAKGKGTVVGLLKVGSKNLYVYDHTGAHHEVKPLCVLDFYVHESKQRMGLGKILYEHMLKEANVLPQDLAIDKPSENFLAFLFKYYGLEHIIPQSNNYVVFDGFFTDRPVMNGSAKVQRYTNCSMPVSTSNNSTRAAGYYDHVKDTFDGIPPTVGRHSAFKPVSTMGAILQNVSVNPYQNDGDRPSTSVSDHTYQPGAVDHRPLEDCFEDMSPVHTPHPKHITTATPKEVDNPAVLLPSNTGKPALSKEELFIEIHQTATKTETQTTPQSCRSDHDDSTPGQLDLKFHHTHLW